MKFYAYEDGELIGEIDLDEKDSSAVHSAFVRFFGADNIVDGITEEGVYDGEVAFVADEALVLVNWKYDD